MRTVQFRSLGMAAAAVLGLSASVAAQGKPEAVLNTLEVRQLVARAEPADNLRLSVHFDALADRYTAEAQLHVSMSQHFVGNPSRNLGAGMTAHCKRLAELNSESAATTRDLAAFHRKLADGSAAVVPRGAEGFRAGAGAAAPKANQLNALAAKASTPAEHRALQEYFTTLSRRYAAESKEHASFASGLRTTRLEHAAAVHSRLSTIAANAAKEAAAAARMHSDLAGVGR